MKLPVKHKLKGYPGGYNAAITAMVETFTREMVK